MKSGKKRVVSGAVSNAAGRFSIDDAAAVAFAALAFLAQDPGRIARFLGATGVEPADLRGLVGESGFQLAILDHLAADEPLLLAFAQEAQTPPEEIGRARRALGGGEQ